MQLREAADALGVHYQTAYLWVRQGSLPARKLGRRGRQYPPVHAAVRHRVEQPADERLASLGVRDLGGADPSLRRRRGDDLLIDVQEAQSVGDEPADLLPGRTDCARDADHVARHGSTLEARGGRGGSWRTRRTQRLSCWKPGGSLSSRPLWLS